MITEEQAKRAIAKAVATGLDGAEWFGGLGVWRVMQTCNGCGPEWMSARFRDCLTSYLELFFSAFCIHDCRYSFTNNGTKERFDEANGELGRNCKRLADAEYGWYNPMRYIWRHRAKIVEAACRDFGWSAWRDAFEDVCRA